MTRAVASSWSRPNCSTIRFATSSGAPGRHDFRLARLDTPYVDRLPEANGSAASTDAELEEVAAIAAAIAHRRFSGVDRSPPASAQSRAGAEPSLWAQRARLDALE